MRQKEFMSVPKQCKVYRQKEKKIEFIPEQCLWRNTESYTSSSCCSIIIILPQFCQLISSHGQTLNFLLASSHQEFLFWVTFTNSWSLFKDVLVFKTSIVGRAVKSLPDIMSLKHSADFLMSRKHSLDCILSLECCADI